MDAEFTSNSQKIVIATAALFNFGRMLNDEPLDDGVHDEDFFADENSGAGQTMHEYEINRFDFCCRPFEIFK